jgi:hypothetical protein
MKFIYKYKLDNLFSIFHLKTILTPKIFENVVKMCCFFSIFDGGHIGIQYGGHLEKYTVCKINVPIRIVVKYTFYLEI